MEEIWATFVNKRPVVSTSPHYVTYVMLIICHLCLHLLLCCKDKHVNNLWTKHHNKVVCILAQTLVAHPITRQVTPIHIGMHNNKNQRTHLCYGYNLAFIVSENVNVSPTHAPISDVLEGKHHQIPHPSSHPLTFMGHKFISDSLIWLAQILGQPSIGKKHRHEYTFNRIFVTEEDKRSLCMEGTHQSLLFVFLKSSRFGYILSSYT